MKKNVIYYIVLIAAVLCLTSCNSSKKKAENLEDLKAKYENKDFKNCDEYIGALNETIDLYFAEIDNIMTNEVEIEDNALELESFLFELFEQSQKYIDECPEKMENFEKDFEERLFGKFEEHGLINNYNYDDLEYYDDEYIIDDEDLLIEETPNEDEIITE